MPSDAPSFRLSPAADRSLTPSATLALNEKVKRMWAAGEEVYHLGFGESRFPPHPKLVSALRAQAERSSYLPTQGLAEVRTCVAEFYRARFALDADPERVMLGPGSKSLLFALLQALDGDLILPTPSWVSYRPQARLLGKAVYWIDGRPEDAYAWTVADLSRSLAALRRRGNVPPILLLNSPNNPTGRLFGADFLAELAQFCRAQGVVVLSDELYGLVTHDGERHVSPAHFYPRGTVVLGGLSKQLSLGGWRFGVALFPPGEGGERLLQAVHVIASETWSATVAPVQYAAQVAFGDDPDIHAYIDECARLHGLRTHYLWRHLTDMGVRCPRPQGGFYLFPDFEQFRGPLAGRGVSTSVQLADYLLDRYRLATLPAAVFGAPPALLALRLASSYLDMETRMQAQALLLSARQMSDPQAWLGAAHPRLNEAAARFRAFIQDLRRG